MKRLLLFLCLAGAAVYVLTPPRAVQEGEGMVISVAQTQANHPAGRQLRSSWGSTLQSLRQEPRAPLANSQEPASTRQNAAYGPRRCEEKNQGSERTLGAYDPAASVAKTSAPAIDKPSPKAALPKAKKQSRSAKPAVRVADEVTKRDRRRGRWARRGDRRRGLGLFGFRGRKAAPSAWSIGPAR